jgi:hypothetical protein
MITVNYRKTIDNILERTMIKPFNSPAVSIITATLYNSVCFSFRQEWLPVDNPCQHPFPQTYSNKLQSALDLGFIQI